MMMLIAHTGLQNSKNINYPCRQSKKLLLTWSNTRLVNNNFISDIGIRLINITLFKM